MLQQNQTIVLSMMIADSRMNERNGLGLVVVLVYHHSAVAAVAAFLWYMETRECFDLEVFRKQLLHHRWYLDHRYHVLEKLDC